jgi:hypothetical protein
VSKARLYLVTDDMRRLSVAPPAPRGNPLRRAWCSLVQSRLTALLTGVMAGLTFGLAAAGLFYHA